jgi:hypothetical protein
MLERYQKLATECAALEAKLTRNFNVVASLRAGAFVLAALLAWFGATRNTPPLQWALLPFLSFCSSCSGTRSSCRSGTGCAAPRRT